MNASALSGWLVTKPVAVVAILTCTLGLYLGLVLLTRIAGLRSFSKLSGFDFPVTVAIGSVLGGSIVAKDPPLLQALIALGVLFGVQMAVAYFRIRSAAARRAVDNEPLLLMRGGEILHDNLRRCQVTEGDLWAKLREANVLSLDQVEAVVMESTGDVSVLHRGDGKRELDQQMLEGVKGRS